jgi:putative transposase
MMALTGMDFFTAEVLTWRGLATYYVVFFLHLETPRDAGRSHTTSNRKMACANGSPGGPCDRRHTLLPIRFVLHDRDSKLSACFQNTLR